MKKILFAICHKATEEKIEERIGQEYMVVGAVAYREAVIEKLEATGADVLLIRESLAGSIDFNRLMKRVRVEFPGVRIVVICTLHPKGDTFLQTMVALGIYDIINSDKPTVTDISSYILTPRTYADAAQFGIGMPDGPKAEALMTESVPTVAVDQEEKAGLLSSFGHLFRGLKATKKQTDTQSGQPGTQDFETSIPRVNENLLRETIRQSEALRAQRNMDTLIREAVTKQTVSLSEENKRLTNKLESLMADLSASERYSTDVLEQLNSLRCERDKLQLMLKELRSQMQNGFEIYEEQLRALQNPENTPEWYMEQSASWEQQKANLIEALTKKTEEADDFNAQIALLTDQARVSSQTISDLRQQLEKARNTQESSVEADVLIARLREEIASARQRNAEMEKRIKTMEKEINAVREAGPDYSRPIVSVPLLPDNAIYTSTGQEPQTVLMIGAKHGVGNTTIALNLATSLASNGCKTLLVEVNGGFPMLNQYFEFTHIPFGFEEAIAAVASGKPLEIDKAVIRPHGLTPSQTGLAKTYKKLPAGIHFLLFSNMSLVSHSYDKNMDISEATIHTFLRYLTKRQQYSYVILDVQSDDYRLIQFLMNSGYPIDKLCVSMTQDPHAIASAGNIITTLSRGHVSSMVASGEFIVNRFNPNAPISIGKIVKMLHLGTNQIHKMSEDSAGYLSAAGIARPYITNKGRFSMEYEQLKIKVIGHK